MVSAVSGSSRDDLGGALDRGELVAPGVPHPFGGAATSMSKGFLKKVKSIAGGMWVMGQIMA